MTTFLTRLRWPTLGLLAVVVLAVPNAPAQQAAPLTADEREKQIQQLEQQKAELQKKIEELKKAQSSPSLATPEGTIPEALLRPFTWRCIGPANMGGRVTSIAAVESDPTTYYIATASGGLLKTVNNGTTFEHLFDNQATVSIGDVAVSQSNPKVVWVGTGENNPRNSVTYGDGVYKSTDGGKTWANMGLKDSFQVGKIVIHPKDPNVVYVGALGRLYGPNAERGVFKTEDGGKTWTKSLFVDDKTGCIDMRMDPQDPNVLIAAMWERKRDEFDGFFGEAPVPDAYGPAVTHGAGGGLYKTADAGKTWKRLSDEKLKNGLPTAKTGRIGLDYSRKTKGLLFAVIDTEKVGTGEFSRIYLGIIGEDAPDKGGAVLTEITPDGPAAKAGLKAGDVVVAIDGKKVETYEGLVGSYQNRKAGDKVKLTVKRDGKELSVEVTIGARPAETTGQGTGGGTGRTGGRTGGAGQVLPPITGVTFGAEGLTVQSVAEGGPAEKAGVKAGDVVTAIDGKPVKTVQEYAAALTGRKAGEAVKLALTRDKKDLTVEVQLAANPRSATQPGGAGQTTILMPGFVPEVGSFRDPVKVASVPAGGAAEKAGVKKGDEVVAINGREVASFRDLMTELRVGPRVEEPRVAGDKVKVTFKEGDKVKEVELALVETSIPGLQGGIARGASNTRPYGMGLGGQQANVQNRQGKDGNQTGGVYVSKDNGDTWTRVNSLNPRPMYFSQIRVDPSDDKTVYVLTDTPTPMYRSTDGGQTFAIVQTAGGVHADAHALWINPRDGRHLIIGCDGGFYVSYDKGARWEHLNTLALGQFYHVAVDNKKPYRVYGGLQDNGSWGGPSHVLRRYGPVNEDWVFVSGGDGFVCRVDPTDPDLVYSESQGGAMGRRNFRTGEQAGIRPPRRQGEEPLRFNWNTPFILSSHNPSIFYCGAQYVYRSVKKGADLKQISPELTRTKKGSMTALAESPLNADVLWAGTDDGHLWVTKDGGAAWANVSANFASAGLPGPRWVATIEASRDKAGQAYVCFDGHRSDDDKPYLFKTEDYGQTWKPITSNLPAFGSTRCLREDIVNADVLYAGTEFGAFVSANRGQSWTKLGSGLPTVAVHEFAQPTVANELVAATHGRSVWVLDVNALRQMKPAVLKEKVALFTPAAAVQWKLGVGGESPYSSTDRRFVGTNPSRGATIDYVLAEDAKKVSLKVQDVTGRTVWEFRPGAGQGGGQFRGGGGGGGAGPARSSADAAAAYAKAGLHRVSWNLSAAAPQGQGQGGGGGGGGGAARRVGGGQVVPGLYRVVLTVDGKEFAQSLAVEMDPNAPKDLVSTGDEEAEEEREEEGKPARIDD